MKRIFSIDDQHWFHAISGDGNPIHVDPAWAATTFPGEVVVHGVHAVVWAIDTIFAAGGVTIDRVAATFVKPIVLGDEVIVEANAERTVIRLFVEGGLMAVVRVAAAEGPPPSLTPGGDPKVPLVDRSTAPVRDLSGSLPARVNGALLAERYPAATRALGGEFIAALTRLSTLVGMECPGLRSMFSEFEVRRDLDRTGQDLDYRVKRYNALFSRLEIAVTGMGIGGSVVAYAGRTASDPDAHAIAAIVEPGRYAGSQPLIIGGSGGLGATSARMLAAGGAAPVITWANGSAGAAQVLRAIEEAGGTARSCRFDVNSVPEGIANLRALDWQGGEVYFFATPRIFRRNLQLFSPDDLRLFMTAYVDRFAELVEAIRGLRGDHPLTFFYPSTVAVEEEVADLLEYGVAKAAGERLCRSLERRLNGVRIVIARLPRIDTRQTQSFVSLPAAPPHEAIAPWIEMVQG